MTISTNQFLATCEATGDNKLAQFICDNFIQIMTMSNPDMNHMTPSDWLSVMLNDYKIVIDDNGNVELEPINETADYILYNEFK
jgi:hypothetical protein